MAKVKTNFSDPFQEIYDIGIDEIPEIQKASLQLLKAEGNMEHMGAELRTSGGKKYLWGPNTEIRMNQWQDFILKTRDKREGFFIHYGQVDNFEKNLWADFVDRHTIQPPLQEFSASWLYNKISNTPEEKAVILSGRLLADFLDWLKASGKELKRDVIFSTFEAFPRHKIPLIFEYFSDWCEYMRSWDGGLTFFRCPHGTYHTFDHITIAKARADESVQVTDLINKAQTFIDHEPGDIVSMDDDYSKCECGLWHRNFKQIAWDNWRLIRADGTQTQRIGVIDDITNDFQIYQERKGEVYLLRVDGWENTELPAIVEKIERNGVKVIPAKGIFRRHIKIPFFFSKLTTSSRGGKIYGFESNIESFEAKLL